MKHSFLYFFMILFLLSNCKTSQTSLTIKGRIAYQEFQDKNNINLYTDSIRQNIRITKEPSKEYSGVIISNTSDELLIIEHSMNNYGIVKGDIVKMNLSGNVIEKIFECERGQIAGRLALSKNDSKLLFIFRNKVQEINNPIQQLNPPIIVYIMDYKSKTIINKIDSLGFSLNVWINKRPWLRDESHFIYDFRTDRQIRIVGDTTNLNTSIQPGIYLYDLNANQSTLLIKNGYSGEVSPNEDKIVFLRKNKICTYNVLSKETDIIYSLKRNEKTAYVEWTPDGEYIYFKRFRNFPYFTSNRILIRVSDKKVIKLKMENSYKLNTI